MSSPRDFRPLHPGGVPSAAEYNRLLAEVQRLTRWKTAEGLVGETGAAGYLSYTDLPLISQLFSGARVYLTSAETILDSTTTDVPFDAALYDVGNYWDVGTPAKFTAPETGYYHIGAYLQFEANATGVRVAEIRDAIPNVIAKDDRQANTAGDDTVITISGDYLLDAGDLVGLVVFQNSGGSLVLRAGTTPAAMWIHRLG